VRASENRRTAARPVQILVFHACEGHEWLARRALAHAAMANTRVLGRREQFIPHGAALAAAGPPDRAFFVYHGLHHCGGRRRRLPAINASTSNGAPGPLSSPSISALCNSSNFFSACPSSDVLGISFVMA